MDINKIIEIASIENASDIHLAFGSKPKARIDGELCDLDFPELTDDDLEGMAKDLLGREMPQLGEEDFSFTSGDRRLRANLYRVGGHISCALRLSSDSIPQIEKLGLPPAVLDFPNLKRGIVLVTGQTGSGKSTTLAAILQRINETRKAHIITLEDPIEYVYKPDKCLIDQREIGSDTESYAEGLRAILREDPDVILIGEMRDLVTVETAITAAETGHLVFATLHTSSAEDSIDRMVGVFPAEKQTQIRMQLSMTLVAVISQQLLPKEGGGRVGAVELMIVNHAIRHLIREGKTPQIANVIATSVDIGGITMDKAIQKLYKFRQISAETAISAARDQDAMRQAIGR